MRISIDGKPIELSPSDRSIVDVADRAGIGIPAPCYRTGKNRGCCQICVVDIDGCRKYACCTAPEDGMRVVVHRSDLMELRKQRAAEYVEQGRKGAPCDCGCSADSSCCG